MISAATYQAYADDIAMALTGVDDAMDTLDLADAIYTDMGSDVNTNEESQAIDFRSAIYRCIAALQTHVQNESGMTVDNWLTGQGIQVYEIFADASDLLGFDISAGNIK